MKPMNVGELIENLKKFDPNLPVKYADDQIYTDVRFLNLVEKQGNYFATQPAESKYPFLLIN